MDKAERKNKFSNLINQYKEFKAQGKLDLTSEQTIRDWLSELLEIFEWDVKDTSQIIQEKPLPKEQKKKLKNIESSFNKPDYTFVKAKEKITFLDAKDITVNIEKDKKCAFQIKSYGWSISAPCAFITNFEEFAIYDCTYVPNIEQDSNFGRIYIKIDDYLDNYDLIEDHLLRGNLYAGKLTELYSDFSNENKMFERVTADFKFAEQLSKFRLALANNILLNNKLLIANNTEFIAYIVQVIINRIIFIRVCESRAIEKEGLLKDFKKSGFWETFKNSSYGIFYEHYDGPLFEKIAEIQELKISNQVFNKLLEYLYYPSPYRFDVIPGKLLSDIYEIFLSKKLFIEGGQVKDKIKLEYLKTNGAVGTPKYLVQDLIKRTISKKDSTMASITSLFNTKIVDYACGSGTFLVELQNYLESLAIEFYINGEIDQNYEKYFIKNNNDVLLNLEGKRFLSAQCIFGVDIDPEAVEVSRMSLSLKIIDVYDSTQIYAEMGVFGMQILKNVGLNVKCGNTLVASDIFKQYPDLLTDEEQLLKTNVFDWESAGGFENVFKVKKGFDYIISNPPYVEVKNYNIEYPYMHNYVKTSYKSARNGKVDLTIPFIEKGISLLNPKGKIGIIVQKRFFKTDYGKVIRGKITSNSLLSQIIDFEANDIFKGRITYIASLILDNTKPTLIYYFKCNESAARIPPTLFELLNKEEDSSKFVELPSESLDENPWNFEEINLLKLKTELLKLGCLGDVLDVKVGIQALWDKAYHVQNVKINNDGTITGDTKLMKNITIEMGACRPLICNEKFYPFRNDSTNTYVLFPYDKDFKPILFDKFCKQFPLAGEYLSDKKTGKPGLSYAEPRNYAAQLKIKGETI
jgi:type I restriction-modification system DNA methylase subunit